MAAAAAATMELGLEDTELRLGLPGGAADAPDQAARQGHAKRVFAETIDLKLQLQTPLLAPASNDDKAPPSPPDSDKAAVVADPEKPPAPKVQAVGWPPVRAFRKNIMAAAPAAAAAEKGGSKEEGAGGCPAAFMKVSMDGAPYLRKVDLKMYGSYQELCKALEAMFSSFAAGVRLQPGAEFVPTYEDKEGDWMLVGDVPWEMFVGSCKRLRIMKASDAIGLAPRAAGKLKNKT